MSKLSVAYFGSGLFAIAPLQALLKNTDIKVVAVICQPDRPVGRKQIMESCPVGKIDLSSVKVLKPKKIKADQEFLDELKSLNIDLAVVASYGQILPQEILDIPKFGFLNLHGSILPKWRGASPIQAAIKSGDSKTGVTLMVMDAKMDHGPVLKTVETDILSDETYETLEIKLSNLAATLLIDNIAKFADNKLKAVPQNHDEATFCKLIKKEAGMINWQKETAAEIERKLRAFSPWPGIYTIWNRNGQELRIKLLKVSICKSIPKSDKPPGTVIEHENQPAIIAADNVPLVIETCQIASKKSCDGKQLCCGYKDFIGTILKQ